MSVVTGLTRALELEALSGSLFHLHAYPYFIHLLLNLLGITATNPLQTFPSFLVAAFFGEPSGTFLDGQHSKPQ
jgi:hypothetical protein